MKYEKKVSELLGILNSINYDNIINELEIISLKKWIEDNKKNKNPLLQELILKVNKIINAKSVTKEEKEKIVELTNYYYKIAIEINELSELIGVIKGIISDNVVNKEELNKLKKWLENNIQLKGIYFYDRVSVIANEMKEDTLLDDNKKQELNNVLQLLLKNSTLNQRIKGVKRALRNNQIIGNKLIELIDDEAVINSIHIEAMKQLEILINDRYSVYDIDSEIIFISLSMIALLNYYDGNFYGYVYDTYKDLYDKYNERRIEGQIRNVISKYKKDNEDEHRLISLILRNAIVPKKYLPSFFDFVFDIYRLNFDYNIELNNDLNEEFLFVYDGIKKGLNFESNELNLKITNKTYTLIKTTKDLLISDDKIEELIKLSVTILKIIDNYYWSNPELELDNQYFKYGFDNWKNKLDKNNFRNVNRNSRVNSRWEPEFKIVDNNIYLLIPKHKIKNTYDCHNLKIEITNNDEIIYFNNTLNVYDNIIGGYRIENDNILISNPLGRLKYKLMCNEEIIYDSKEKLFRNYIFFNNEGFELKNNRDYDGMALLCYKSELESITNIIKQDNYNIGYLMIKKGDYIKIGDDIFNFSTILKPGIVGKEYDGKCIINDIEMSIYENIEGIVYETDSNQNRIALVINGKRIKLDDFNVVVKTRGLYYSYFIKIDLEPNKYEILIEENKNDKYTVFKSFTFILDKSFNYEVMPIKDNSYLINIELLNQKYPKTVDYKINDINKIEFKKNNLCFILPLNIPSFKLDDNYWCSLDDYLWLGDVNLHSNLRINGIKFTKAVIKDENKNILTTIYPIVDNYYLDIPIGVLHSYSFFDYVSINFYFNDKFAGSLYCYCQCVVNNSLTKFWYDQKKGKYKGFISYYGKGNIVVNAYDKNKKVVFTKQINNNENIEIDNLKSFEKYKLELVERKSGFTLKKESVIYEKEIKYYLINDFIGKYFQIYTVDYDQTINGIWQRKTRKLLNTYIEITSRISDYNFIGNIYIYNGEKKYLNKINPVEIEFTSDINDGQIEASITKDGDGLFNDFVNNSILNETYSKNAIDIFSYLINMERRK